MIAQSDQSSDETKAEVVSTATNLNRLRKKTLTIGLDASSQLAKSLLIAADIIYHSVPIPAAMRDSI